MDCSRIPGINALSHASLQKTWRQTICVTGQLLLEPSVQTCFVFQHGPERWMCILGHPLLTAPKGFLGLALFLAKLLERQCSVLTCDKSAMTPEQASLLSIGIRWILSCCSGPRVVEAVVTRLLASVRMWISASIPLMSFHKPRGIWHVPKHFMRAYSSAAVVLRVMRLIFVDSKNIEERVGEIFDSHDSHRTLRGLVTVVPERSIRNTNDPRRALDRPHTQRSPPSLRIWRQNLLSSLQCPMAGAAEADANLEKL